MKFLSLCLDRLCHLSIAHLEAGGIAHDRREKKLEDTTLQRDADGKLL